MKTRKRIICDTIEDLVMNLLYYGRKEDEELPMDAIQEAVEAGEITADEMVEHFRKKLTEGL